MALQHARLFVPAELHYLAMPLTPSICLVSIFDLMGFIFAVAYKESLTAGPTYFTGIGTIFLFFGFCGCGSLAYFVWKARKSFDDWRQPNTPLDQTQTQTPETETETETETNSVHTFIDGVVT